MSNIDLEFITTASNDDNKYQISGIPDIIWQKFKEKSREEMPEKGEMAWASVLVEIIQKHIQSSVYTFIMTDIPQKARTEFERTAAQADLSMDDIIRIMFRSANTETLHILNMLSEEAVKVGFRTLFLVGISNIAWEAWRQAARTVYMAPEELLGHVLEAAASGTLELTPHPSNENEVNFENLDAVMGNDQRK